MALTEKLLDGSLVLPGMVVPPKDMPLETQTPLPPKPTLHVMPWSGIEVEGVETLTTPEYIIKKWHDHPRYGQDCWRD